MQRFMQNRKGITLIEVLVSVIILSVGITACYRPLLASVNALKYADERMEANYVLSAQAWQLQEEGVKGGKVSEGMSESMCPAQAKAYRCQKAVKYLSDDGRLSRVDLRVMWKNSQMVKSIEREFFLIFPRKEDKLL